MNQPLDNFFREKLEHVHKPAPAAAWDKIDAGLEDRQRKGLWLKIAASLLIVATASFILWPRQQDATQMADRSKSKKNIPQASPKPKDSAPTLPPAPSLPAVTINPAPVTKPQVKKQRPAAPAGVDIHDLSEQDQPSIAYEDHETPQVVTGSAPAYESAVPVQPAPASADVVLADAATEEETDEAVTLVYSADEINEKYLDKEALAKATSAQKKPSTFRKLLEKAYDLKNNQDPMGGLRQRKNEILALNFKSEKRSQNK